MKVCLINASYMKRKPIDGDYSMSGFSVPHIGLGYIAAYVRHHGHTVDLFECMGQSINMNTICEKASSMEYDAVGLSIYDLNKKESFHIVSAIRKILPEVFLFAGGYVATLSFRVLLENLPELNCCVLGEGEKTTLALIEALQSGGDYRRIAGIAFIEDGVVCQTQPAKLIENLDELPFPDRAFVNARKTLTMVASRGCNKCCLYCSIISFYRSCIGAQYRKRSARNIVDEVDSLENQYGMIQSICFYDDNFFGQPSENERNIMEFANLMKQREKIIPFAITVCVTDLLALEHLVPLLCEAGLYRVFIGVESFNQRQLDFYQKGTTVDENIRAIRLLQKHELSISLGLIALDPFVTLDEVAVNFQMLKDLEVYNAAGSPFSMHTYLIAVPNTPLARYITQHELNRNNDRGYFYKLDTVQLLHDYMQKWTKATMPLIRESYSIDRTRESGQWKLYKKLLSIYRNFLLLDIDYVLAVIACIQRGEDTQSIYTDYYIRYHDVEKQYLDVASCRSERQTYHASI